MAKLVECVPNISEGRDSSVVEQCMDAVRAVPGVTVLDYSSDTSHNRTVITYIGSPEGVKAAGTALAQKCAQLIDLTKHSGEHPRMGALDVLPFIAIKDVSAEELTSLARETAEQIYGAAGIPVFLYEQSATAPNRKNLADIRRGEFEGMAQKVMQPEWQPDFGGRTVHPTAGVCAVGVRAPLVAFNINLSTSDVEIAKKIAKIIRRSSGGFECVKAIGVLLEPRNTAQVSINMTDYRVTPLYRVLETVRFEAARYGVSVVGTEIIGLTPMRALADAAEYYLQIENFSAEHQILENYLL